MPADLAVLPADLDTVPEDLDTEPDALETAPEFLETVPEFRETVPAVLDTDDDTLRVIALLLVDAVLLTDLNPEVELREAEDTVRETEDTLDPLGTAEVCEPYDPVELREP